jgi:hypothetical protein
MNVKFKVSHFNLVFCHSSQFLAPFPHEEQWVSQHIHQPNFSYLFFLHLLFWLSSRVSFLLLFISFLWNNVQHLNNLVIFIFFNWMPSFSFHQFSFPTSSSICPIVLARIMSGSQNGEFNKNGKSTPFPMPSILWFYPFTFGSSIMKKRGILQLALQLNFWVAMTTCNSLYFYIVKV